MIDSKIELGEDGLGAARLDIMKAVVLKLVTGIDNHQVSGIELAPHIVYADSNETLRTLQVIERLSATAYDDGFVFVNILKGSST